MSSIEYSNKINITHLIRYYRTEDYCTTKLSIEPYELHVRSRLLFEGFKEFGRRWLHTTGVAADIIPISDKDAEVLIASGAIR